MTDTTSARCKNSPLKRSGGNPPPTAFGEHFTAYHKILNLDGVSRNDHRNAVVVQERYSTYEKQRKMHKKQHLVCGGLHKNMSGPPMDT